MVSDIVNELLVSHIHMSVLNNSEVQHFLLDFLIPGLEYAHTWISIPSSSCTSLLSQVTALSFLSPRQSPPFMSPSIISLPCWLSLIWACPSLPFLPCLGSSFSMLWESHPMPALLKSSLSMGSLSWNPLCF